ncbi:hypothetical protein ACFYVR_13100 [Rhodococcus sp. NPDC003318]|uniref:hypothetical protein n=1 Tax=Rhodococcus sp. NPDC003318 TaxID=3364503 RepID=UPI00367BE469
MTGAVRAYARILRERWRFVAVAGLGALAVTAIVLLLVPSLYRSGFTVFVRTPGEVSQVEDGGDSYARSRAQSYAELAHSPDLAARVVRNLGLDTSPEEFAGRVTATARPGTVLIDVTLAAPTAREANLAAAAYAGEFAETVQSLESVPGSVLPRAELVVVDPPGRPTRVTEWGPPPMYLLLGALLAGALLGAAAAVLRSIHAPSLRDPRDASRVAGLPVLGTIGVPTGRTSPVDARLTWRRLLSLLGDPDRGVIAVTDSGNGRCAAATALALAAAARTRGDVTLLVDLDLDSPELSRRLDGGDGAGVADVLLGDATVPTALSVGPWGPVLTAGSAAGRTSDPLRDSGLSDLLDHLRADHRWVLLACPPIRSGARACDVMADCDALVVTVRYGVTTEPELHESALLRPARPVAGLVVYSERERGASTSDDAEHPERMRAT